MSQKKEAGEAIQAWWEALIQEAANTPFKKKAETEDVVEITVAEVLGIGHSMTCPPEVAVVKDSEGRVWLVPETYGNDGDLDGLVSRHNIKPGMRLRLKIKSKKQTIYETAAFPLTPEV